jgi:wobble nucleotide-excising tRNase
MISKIEIRDTATFGSVAQSLPDLKKLNFFFGANGTGKTTISKFISDSVKFPNCSIEWYGGIVLDTCVYSRDFVDRNFTQTNTVKGVFTLGEKQTEIVQEIHDTLALIEQLDKDIAQINDTLANQDGITVQLEETYKNKFWMAKISHEDKLKAGMTGFLNDKAKFKEKVLVESVNTTVQLVSQSELEDKARTVFNKSLTEVAPLPMPQTNILLRQEQDPILAKVIIGNENVDIAAIIKRLGNSDWVRQGIPYYEANNNVCPFCQQKTDEKMAQSLTDYFDSTFQAEMGAVASFLSQYQSESVIVQQQLQRYLDLNIGFIDSNKLKSEKAVLDKLISANIQKLFQKQKEPSKVVSLDSLKNTFDAIFALLNDANGRIDKQNQMVRNFVNEKRILTQQIWRLIVEELKDEIDSYKKQKLGLEKAIENLKKQLSDKSKEKEEKKAKIRKLEMQTTSIQPTLNAINNRLDSFGFQSFKLAKVENGQSYKLVRPNGTDVDHSLSEGEKNFLAFLYFFHLLKGSHEQSGTISNKVVVFDDPICSLDNDVLFIVSTLIRGLFDEIRKGTGTIKQIFVLTHNVYFHKEVTFKQTGSDVTFTLVKKNGAESFVEREARNPIVTAYELLWREVKDENRNKATIQNTLRRILENYFKLLGNIQLNDLVNKFDGEDKIKCQALVSWVHDGSHSILSEDYYTPLDDSAIRRYLEVFKQIFEKTNHIAHYNMMMGISFESAEAERETAINA